MLKFDLTSGELVINPQQIISSLPNESQITVKSHYHIEQSEIFVRVILSS